MNRRPYARFRVAAPAPITAWPAMPFPIYRVVRFQACAHGPAAPTFTTPCNWNAMRVPTASVGVMTHCHPVIGPFVRVSHPTRLHRTPNTCQPPFLNASSLPTLHNNHCDVHTYRPSLYDAPRAHCVAPIPPGRTSPDHFNNYLFNHENNRLFILIGSFDFLLLALHVPTVFPTPAPHAS